MKRDSFDILVIGSGMGGMTAAALLSREGYRVLVVEQMDRLGGRCSSVDVQGFKCITGVVGIEMKGVVENLFHEVSASFPVEPAGQPHYLLDRNFCKVPTQGGLKHLLLKSGGNPVEVQKIMDAMGKAMKWRQPSPRVSLYEWLCGFTRQPCILQVFETLVTTVMFVGLKQVSAGTYFEFLRKLKGIRHFGYAVGGSIALPESLKNVVQENGGEVRTNCRVTAITMEKGMVRGARLAWNGRETKVYARTIISNAGPLKTAALAGREHLDDHYLKELTENDIPAPVILIQAAMKEPFFEGQDLLITGRKRLNAIYQPTRICPDWAPEKQSLLVAGAIPLKNDSKENYEREIQASIEELFEVIPDFEKKGKILKSGILHGSFPGMFFPPGRDTDLKTPVINLYNVGDGVKQPGFAGLPAVVNSGILVAEEIMLRNSLFTGHAL